AEEAQDAQGVLADAGLSVADEDDAAGLHVGEAAAGGVVERSGGVGVDRVEAEIAALGVLGPVFGEGDDRAAAVGLDIAAQGGDLVGPALGDGGDGAVVDAGRDSLQPRLLQGGDHPLGRQGGGDVDVVDLFA